MHGVAVEVQREVDRLIAETHNASYAATKWHRPDASARSVISGGGLAAALASPVRSDDGPGVNVPTLFQVVGDEVLEQHLIYIGPVSGAGNGEYVIDQGSDGPMSRLDQRDCGRAEAQLTLTEGRTGGGREDDGRPETPDQLAGFCRRNKEGWVHVPKPKLSASVRAGGGLPDDRLNGPRDQHPFFVEANGNYGLNVEHVLRSVVRPDAKVRIVLKGNAYQTGDGVLRGFSQVSRLVCCCGGLGPSLCLLRGEAYSGVMRRPSAFDPNQRGGVLPLVEVAVWRRKI